jgi:hypothetical protein
MYGTQITVFMCAQFILLRIYYKGDMSKLRTSYVRLFSKFVGLIQIFNTNFNNFYCPDIGTNDDRILPFTILSM